MEKICYRQFDQEILLLIKICTINLMIKNACGKFGQRILLLVKFTQLIYWQNFVCGQFGQGILLLVKICTIKLLVNVYTVNSLLKLQSTHLSIANAVIYWEAKLRAFYIYSRKYVSKEQDVSRAQFNFITTTNGVIL
jgi:hypothetical protein